MQTLQERIKEVYREAIAVLARTGRSGKRKTQLNANAFCCHLSVSGCICG
jgi:hypothetical protein